ncbi:MAG: hypothetical protein RMX68_030230 [Aulosira sp. ZfuVER01]|nr:hypothetical protein [Aulosira sp. ZfuVER01]MDZ7997731.1 hypothetical protein [Aulosira sp. DedVER01a]MDZ8052226.1 hypothetical protein [Aulosira sp. ZfuCHP01]
MVSHCGGRVSRHKGGSALGGSADLKQLPSSGEPEGQRAEGKTGNFCFEGSLLFSAR